MTNNLKNERDTLDLIVKELRHESEGVKSLTLVSPTQADLPAFTAGSHIEFMLPVALPGGLRRQYSIANDPAETHRYVVAVGLHPSSRGGSKYIHEELKEGDMLQVTLPRNRFVLDENAQMTILVAGGIGVTPLMSMASRLSAIERHWRMYYCVKTPAHAAFLDKLLALGGEVIPVYDGCPGVTTLNLKEVVESASADTHLYCCGPLPMMRAFEDAGRRRPAATMHVEWFEAPLESVESVDDTGHGQQILTVHLARAGLTVEVPPDRSILDALHDVGVDVPNSCGDGICGTCETRVLAGRPLHHDHVLTAAEREKGDCMMVCVSRSIDSELTLDL